MIKLGRIDILTILNHYVVGVGILDQEPWLGSERPPPQLDLVQVLVFLCVRIQPGYIDIGE